MNRYLAIVPAHNEVGAIAATVGEIRSGAPDFDVLVIDDGSVDGTADAARAAGARVVSLPFNLGVGAAVQTGYLYARRNGYEVAVQVDGDGQHDPRDISRLLAVLLCEPGTHLVTGSRFLAAGGDRSSAYR
ncbi:MAG TPA: glycosyltransferase family 2 protein, partial [Solirubrobacteraceae bacterium]|nr:glycosyltransferase family 2 protein [Solirubrobacteraceae bacterium]